MIINDLPKVMLICLLLTIIIEVLVSLVLRVQDKKDIINIILVNVLTNPSVVVFPYIIGLYYGITYRYILLIILELYAFFMEGFIYKKVLKYKKINCYLLSLILNLSSYFIGDIIGKLIW